MELSKQYNNWYKQNKSWFLWWSCFSINKRLEYEVIFLSDFIKKIFNRKITLLSIGCGEFKMEQKLFELWYIDKATWIDISEYIIQKNNQIYKNNNFEFFNTNILDFNFNNKKYDIIFLGGVLLYNNESNVIDILKHIKNKSIYVISRDSCSSFKEFTKNKTFLTYYRHKNFYEKIFMKIFWNIKSKFNWWYYNIVTYDFLSKYHLPNILLLIYLLNIIRIFKNYYKNDLYNYFFISKNKVKWN